MRDTIRFVGSGDSFGSGGRFQTCILGDLGGRRFLLDCGASSLIALRSQGIDPNSIEVILLTHMHGDHCAGVPFLLLDAMLGAKRQAPLLVAGPEGTESRMDQLREALFPGSGAMRPRFDYRYVTMRSGATNDIDGISVRPYPAVHTPETSPTMLRVECAGKVLMYTGDTEWTDDIIAAADGADLLITECCFFEKPVRTHMNYLALKAQLARVRAKAVVLTHMSPEMLAHAHEVPERCAHDGLEVEI